MNVDIGKMSGETGISLSAIKKALGIPIEVSVKASNFKEAKAVYDKAPSGSEEKKAALIKLISFSSTIEEIIAAHDRAPSGSEEKVVALIKWRKFSTKEIEKASTLKEAEAAYDITPSDSEEEKAAIRKISTFYQR